MKSHKSLDTLSRRWWGLANTQCKIMRIVFKTDCFGPTAVHFGCSFAFFNESTHLFKRVCPSIHHAFPKDPRNNLISVTDDIGSSENTHTRASTHALKATAEISVMGVPRGCGIAKRTQTHTHVRSNAPPKWTRSRFQGTHLMFGMTKFVFSYLSINWSYDLVSQLYRKNDVARWRRRSGSHLHHTQWKLSLQQNFKAMNEAEHAYYIYPLT